MYKNFISINEIFSIENIIDNIVWIVISGFAGYFWKNKYMVIRNSKSFILIFAFRAEYRILDIISKPFEIWKLENLSDWQFIVILVPSTKLLTIKLQCMLNLSELKLRQIDGLKQLSDEEFEKFLCELHASKGNHEPLFQKYNIKKKIN